MSGRPTALRLLIVALTTAVVGLGAIATFNHFRPAQQRQGWVDRYVAAYQTNGRTRSLSATSCSSVLAKARSLVTPSIRYDPSYVGLVFPNGDVPAHQGVCADVIVRAFRGDGRDLQALLNSDMKADFARYPQLWRMRGPDSNIDHRRVPNLMQWFTRNGAVLPMSKASADYQPCDVVAWDLGKGLTHIGLVSDRSIDGRPAIIHHIGGHPTEEDVLFDWRMIGHFAF